MMKELFHITIDLEMSELTPEEMSCVFLRNEVIQIGAVILDKDFKFVDKFQIFVKPQYSHITTFINNLTGISESDIENAVDFVTAFEKYIDWVKSNVKDCEFVTYCWSQMDHKQIYDELFLKAKDRKDLMENLKTFVDLQRTFSELIGTKISIGLETAIKFCNETFDGQAHTALADAYNTAVILHKIFKVKLNPHFHYIQENEQIAEQEEEEIKNSYKSNLGSMISPELLKQFGLESEKKEFEDDFKKYENYIPQKLSKNEKKLLKKQKKEQKIRSRLDPIIRKQIINHHPTLRYNINPITWMKFYVKMLYSKANLQFEVKNE